MSYRRKTWEEKLMDNKNFPKTLKLESNFPCYRALEKMGAEPGNSVVLAPPLDVNTIMKQIPEGELVTLKEICEKLAEKHQTQYCCTLTTGIFVNIVANAAEEMKRDVPYWRTIKNDGQLNDKFPGGAEQQKQLLENEGHTIIEKGRKHIRYYVKDFEQSLIKTADVHV
jgi:alkylated DNA nucleotide flippase Atl1